VVVAVVVDAADAAMFAAADAAMFVTDGDCACACVDETERSWACLWIFATVAPLRPMTAPTQTVGM
jgi:hypothetical protein